MLGHPELIFDRYDFANNTIDFAHAGEQWQLSDDFAEVLSDECYFCEKHKYVQLYYSREDRYRQYEKITDQNLLSQLKETYKKIVEQPRERGSASPILLSSFS